ncbi:MAG: UDP-3-O-acyl-N-acetylglucosamine deacetylase [Alphaproteobacteria bacterium]|nr:UDP-3-O-acyl-N-acetylglucosamine deacetylase [Alphaproteobacteria bacterium]
MQRTLKAPIHCTGAGLHSNAKVSMTLSPAAPGTGIMFRRTDLATDAEIKAHHDNIVDSRLCTTIGNGNGLSVGTIEHLMAAFAGCSVDNAIVELTGAEVPIMDGSARAFVFLIECAGIVEQNTPRRAIQVLKDISVGNENRWASISPAEHFSLHCEIVFDHHAIGSQSFDYDSRLSSFEDELSTARTFCLAADVEEMRAAGLALGGSLDNAVVIGEHGLLNDEGLRFETEFARHKALDLIGDLSLAGTPLLAHVESHCAGHAMNHQLLDALLDDDTAWCWTDMDEHGAERMDAAVQVRHAAAAAST